MISDKSVSILNKNIFLFILIFIFAVYIFFSLRPIETLVTNFFVDDAFYYFKTASNLAGGLGPTFDGEHLTNGYHPLWMGIITLIYYFSADDKILPLHIILFLSTLFYFLATLLVWKIISIFLKEERIQYVLVLVYALNPWNLANYLNGLETPLALFLFSLFFWIFLKMLYGEDKIKNFLFLGLVAGFLVLSRLDYGLFAAAVSIFFLIRIKYFSWKSILSFVLPATAVALPWFLYNYFYFGSPIPTSGLSYTLINHRLWFYKDRSLGAILLWSLYNFFGTIAFTFKTIGLPVFYSAKNVVKSFFWMAGIFFIPATIILYFYFKKNVKFKVFLKSIFASREWRAFFVIFLGYFSLVLIHGAIRWSGRPWYFSAFQILTIIFLAIILSRESLSIYRKKILIALIVFFSISYFSYFKIIFPQLSNQSEMYQISLWMRNNLPANARVASFNSGIYGYFSDRFIMNSDGLINNAAYEALGKNRLWDLFKRNNIGYIVDYNVTLTYRYKPFLGIDDPFSKIKKIDTPDFTNSANYGGSHVSVYKITEY